MGAPSVLAVAFCLRATSAFQIEVELQLSHTTLLAATRMWTAMAHGPFSQVLGLDK